MTIDERKEFWEALLKAKNESDIAMVNSKIIYPEKIYRYRSVSTRTLNAIAENEIYFSTPSQYDDPFDTFIRINNHKISEQIKNLSSYPTENFNNYIELNFPNFSDDMKQKILETQILASLKEERYKLREKIWTACFTEKYDNETMWLKYAKNHEGLVLEYDVENFKRGNIQLKINPPDEKILENTHLSLYPVYYSKEIYDATNYALFLSIICSLEKMGNSDDVIKFMLDGDSHKWELERILLIKKFVHHYDDEWRLVLDNKYTINKKLSPRIINFRPSKIILGLNISDDDKKAVLMAARHAGIENIEQMIINDDDEFVAKPI